MSQQEYQEKKFLETKERYTFVQWGKKFHIVSGSGNIFCGKAVPQQIKSGEPNKLEQVCRTCWWNKG